MREVRLILTTAAASGGRSNRTVLLQSSALDLCIQSIVQVSVESVGDTLGESLTDLTADHRRFADTKRMAEMKARQLTAACQ